MLRIILLLILTSSALAAENLNRDDFVGEWHSNWPTTDGETNKLNISSDFESTFLRQFSNKHLDQSFEVSAKQIRFIDDVIVIECRDESHALRYKLVLSGWKSDSTRRLFGTMFMYSDGKLFNGLPISLEIGE